MLATLNQVLKIAEEKQYAIAAFNTPTLESLQAAVDKAEEHQVPVIELEQSTIDSYNEASRIAAEHKDAVTHKMFQDIIVEVHRCFITLIYVCFQLTFSHDITHR